MRAPKRIDNADERQAAYNRETGTLVFTKDFDTALKAIIADEECSATERVLAWIKLRSWGEWSLYAVRDDGQPARQCDCVRALELIGAPLKKSTVCHAVTSLEARGFVDSSDGLLRPVINPALHLCSSKVADSPNFSAFIDEWKVADSPNFSAWETARAIKEVADAEYKRLEQVRLSAYKKWRASQTKDAPSLDKTEDKSLRAEPAAAAVSTYVEEEAKPAAAAPTPSIHEEPPETTETARVTAEEIQIVAVALRDTPAAAKRLIDRCREQAPDAQATDIVHFIRINEKRADLADNRTGWLIRVVSESFEGDWKALRDKPPPDRLSATHQKLAEAQEARRKLIAEIEQEQEQRKKTASDA